MTDYSVEQNVEDGIFRFTPPLIGRSPRPKNLYLMWRAFQHVFSDIVDPQTFPPLPDRPSGDDFEMYERYVLAAEELAESELLCGEDWLTTTWDASGTIETEASFTSKEITRGFAGLLRQFDSPHEKASFGRVRGGLRVASAASTDGKADARCSQLDAWGRARGRLHGTELARLARRAVAPALEYGNRHPPTHYMSVYNYGDLLHWGKKRDVFAKWEQDEFSKHHERMAFLEAATGLAYLYIGFSELVRTAVGLRAIT